MKYEYRVVYYNRTKLGKLYCIGYSVDPIKNLTSARSVVKNRSSESLVVKIERRKVGEWEEVKDGE